MRPSTVMASRRITFFFLAGAPWPRNKSALRARACSMGVLLFPVLGELTRAFVRRGGGGRGFVGRMFRRGLGGLGCGFGAFAGRLGVRSPCRGSLRFGGLGAGLGCLGRGRFAFRLPLLERVLALALALALFAVDALLRVLQ